jgi:F-type H+-transporting ATPase subunit epsilon
MANFKTILITPEKRVMEGDVESVLVPGSGGGFEILSGHAPLVGAISAGVLKVRKDGVLSLYAVGGGIVEVNKGAATIMVDFAVQVQGNAEALEVIKKAATAIGEPALSPQTF